MYRLGLTGTLHKEYKFYFSIAAWNVFSLSRKISENRKFHEIQKRLFMGNVINFRIHYRFDFQILNSATYKFSEANSLDYVTRISK